jgi:DNA-binding transcriptional regulator LsrR (DeoR family)
MLKRPSSAIIFWRGGTQFRRWDINRTKLDEAARAGWLYFVAGNTQDEIARKLGVSRQAAQRLVSLAVSEKLIRVQLAHPIAQCMELARALSERYALKRCEVVPADPASSSAVLGVAQATAAEMQRHLASPKPITLALGTGRILRAAVDNLLPVACPRHRIVSLVGNLAADGSASSYDVIEKMADTVKAPHYPMMLPVIAESAGERRALVELRPVRKVFELARQAHISFVGIGQMDSNAPLLEDGFITRAELNVLRRAGAVGDIIGWAFDQQGNMIQGLTNARVASVPLAKPARRLVFGAAMGKHKVQAILGALRGRLINGLITNEATARALLTPAIGR